MIKQIIAKIPIREIKKIESAIFSKIISLFSFLVLIERKDNIDEQVSNKAIIDVNSSTIEFSDLLEICNDEITNKQNPNKLVDVDNMCCEVLVGIKLKTFASDNLNV